MNKPGFSVNLRTRPNGKQILYIHTKRGIKTSPESRGGEMMNFTITVLCKAHKLDLYKM